MLRKTRDCTEYKNGNITIKYSKGTYYMAKRYEFETLSWVLSEINCKFIGKPYNRDEEWKPWDTLYNAHSDLVYTFSMEDQEKLRRGKMIRLYARKPTATDYENMEKTAIAYQRNKQLLGI